MASFEDLKKMMSCTADSLEAAKRAMPNARPAERSGGAYTKHQQLAPTAQCAGHEAFQHSARNLRDLGLTVQTCL